MLLETICLNTTRCSRGDFTQPSFLIYIIFCDFVRTCGEKIKRDEDQTRETEKERMKERETERERERERDSERERERERDRETERQIEKRYR